MTRTSPRLMTLMLLFVTVAASTWVAKPQKSEARPRRGYSFTSIERCLMRKVNRHRVRHGKRRLDPDKQLGYVARKHATLMSSAGDTWHKADLSSTITRWRRLGQTVGKGMRCRSLFRAFWRSGVHRRIMMGRFRFIGVGSHWRNGRVYVHKIFESRRNPGNIFSYP